MHLVTLLVFIKFFNQSESLKRTKRKLMLEFLPRIVFRVPTQLMRRFYLRLANHFTTKSFFGLLVIRSSDYVNRLKIFLGLQFYRNWWITQSSSIDLAHFCFNVWINRFVECVQKWTGWWQTSQRNWRTL